MSKKGFSHFFLVLIVAVLILVCVMVLIFQNRSQKQQKAVAETEEITEQATEEVVQQEEESELTEEAERQQYEEVQKEENSGQDEIEKHPDGEGQNFVEPQAEDAGVEVDNGVAGSGVSMSFADVEETVTAKEAVNLRDIPSQGEDSMVLATLINGDTAMRTGVSESGWSRVEYGGGTYYAVSSYLTTDLSYTAPGKVEGTGDGLKTKFKNCSDVMTAKIEVNLRALPSVTNPDATVIATLHNGETVTRTGINEEYGWSRVDYNGQTLYCISSYLTPVQ